MFEEMNKVIEDTKEKFTTFVVDKTIPLEERFKLWLEAPDCLKEHRGSIDHTLESAIEKVLGSDVSWYDDFRIDRYQTVELSAIFETLSERLANEMCSSEYSKVESLHVLPGLEGLAETIIQHNVRSFLYDW